MNFLTFIVPFYLDTARVHPEGSANRFSLARELTYAEIIRLDVRILNFLLVPGVGVEDV